MDEKALKQAAEQLAAFMMKDGNRFCRGCTTESMNPLAHACLHGPGTLLMAHPQEVLQCLDVDLRNQAAMHIEHLADYIDENMFDSLQPGRKPS